MKPNLIPYSKTPAPSQVILYFWYWAIKFKGGGVLLTPSLGLNLLHTANSHVISRHYAETNTSHFITSCEMETQHWCK